MHIYEKFKMPLKYENILKNALSFQEKNWKCISKSCV